MSIKRVLWLIVMACLGISLYTIVISRNVKVEEKVIVGGAEGGMTSERLESKLNSEYPFSFNVTLSSNVIRVGDTSQYYTFAMSWPYESGDDVQDTYWGNMAYDYHEA